MKGATRREAICLVGERSAEKQPLLYPAGVRLFVLPDKLKTLTPHQFNQLQLTLVGWVIS